MTSPTEFRKTPFQHQPIQDIWFKNRQEAIDYINKSHDPMAAQKPVIIDNVNAALLHFFQEHYPEEFESFCKRCNQSTPFEKGYKACQLFENDNNKKLKLIRTDFISIRYQYEKERIKALVDTNIHSPVFKPISVNIDELKLQDENI